MFSLASGASDGVLRLLGKTEGGVGVGVFRFGLNGILGVFNLGRWSVLIWTLVILTLALGASSGHWSLGFHWIAGRSHWVVWTWVFTGSLGRSHLGIWSFSLVHWVVFDLDFGAALMGLAFSI